MYSLLLSRHVFDVLVTPIQACVRCTRYSYPGMCSMYSLLLSRHVFDVLVTPIQACVRCTRYSYPGMCSMYSLLLSIGSSMRSLAEDTTVLK